ncbi:MAG: metallophosphoesterase [Eubacteriales bacterium]|nr:metallophosphoesterase [Eubacteriales bacterium]
MPQADNNKIFAISDLHLPGSKQKTMDLFGLNWEGHFDKIKSDWYSKVSENDIVLLPGDISWAMTLDEAMPDILSIGELPGNKVLLRGNHDYWWSSISRLREALPTKMFAVQNDAIKINDTIICGTRGWANTEGEESPSDKKIYEREIKRLMLSLENAKDIQKKEKVVAMMHYPPLDLEGNDSPFTELFEKFNVSAVVYGHLHGAAKYSAFNGVKNGVLYRLVSCDALNFCLSKIDI